jgi:DNA-binding transcriptional LysR family regulator
MTIAQLRAFLSALEFGSFTAAADELDSTQASVSELIARLEEFLGSKLFIRGARNLVPTAAALALKVHATAAISELAAGERAVRDLVSLEGGVSTFGVMRNAGYYELADLAQTFHKDYPNVKIRLVGLNSVLVAESIASGEIEGGLIVLPVAEEGLEVTPLFRDEVFFASTTRPANAGPVTIEEFSEANLILYDAHAGWLDPTRRQILERAKASGVKIDPIVEVEHIEACIRMVESGTGETVFSRSVIEGPNFPKNIRLFRFSPPLYDTIAVVKREGSRLSPATEKFAELAAEKLLENLGLEDGKDQGLPIVALKSSRMLKQFG